MNVFQCVVVNVQTNLSMSDMQGVNVTVCTPAVPAGIPRVDIHCIEPRHFQDVCSSLFQFFFFFLLPVCYVR